MRNLLLLCAAALVACGGSIDSIQDSGPPPEGDAGTTPSEGGVVVADGGITPVVDGGAPAAISFPQVESYGGPVLTAPTVIPIFFPNDNEQSKVEDFLKQLSASTFWGDATKEYGVGALSVGTSIVVTDTPPTTIDVASIESWLASYLDGTHPDWPAIAQNNVYTVFYPSTTTITDQNFGTSCVEFGGYHYEAKGAGGKSIVYAVLPRCTSLGQVVQGFDALTAGLSHELIEAATDPLMSNPAYSFVDVEHMVWNIMPLGEIGDMCAYEPQSYQRLVSSYMVQRPWSNVSAKAGHDPCVPTLTDAYFNAAPVLNDSVTLDYYGQQVQTKGVTIPLGQSKTIDVELFSDAPTADWSVQAVDATYGTSQPKQLSFTWDAQKGNSGTVLHLTITRIADGPYQGSEFFIYSQRGYTTANMWFGFAAN